MKSTKIANKSTIILTFCLFYTIAYGVSRSSNWLIHHIGYYFEADQSRRRVAIYPSDFRTPVLAQGVAYIFFGPVTKLELVFGYLIDPQRAS